MAFQFHTSTDAFTATDTVIPHLDQPVVFSDGFTVTDTVAITVDSTVDSTVTGYRCQYRCLYRYC